MWRKPVLQILNGGGRNILPGLAGFWLSCTVTDRAGTESDEAEIVCVGPPSKFGLPAKGETFSISGGWADEGPVLQGIYTVQGINASGDAQGGETISITLRAGDFVDKLKATGQAHYDDMSFGDLVKKLAGEAGLGALVDPALASIKVPYRMRWQQSPIDFLTELGEEIGAVVKPAGGKLIAVKRGAGTSASGATLEPILIRKRQRYGYEIDIEPRPEVGSIAAAWQDPASGRRKLVKENTGRTGPIFTLPHPYRSEKEARAAAKAEAYERGNNSGEGRFDSPGMPRAWAEAPVIVSGFGAPIDGRWKAESVTKTWSVKTGFTTKVEVKAGAEKKAEKEAEKEG